MSESLWHYEKHDFNPSAKDSEKCAVCSGYRGHPSHYPHLFDFTCKPERQTNFIQRSVGRELSNAQHKS